MATPGRNPTAPTRLRGQQLRLTSLAFCHRPNHGLDTLELVLALLQHAVVDLVHAGDHFHEPSEGSHPLDQTHLLEEVREVERRLLQLLLHFFNVGEFDLFLSLLHQREHIPHAEDAARHPLWMERLKCLNLFTGANELDRLAAHFADGQCGATAGITIQLGEHSPGNTHLLMEGTG